MDYDIWGKPVKGGNPFNMGFGGGNKQIKKRVKLTPGQRLYIWEHPKLYGRTCSICHHKITKQSELELDHTKAHSKGGTKMALAHRDCNRVKSSGSLRKIQKALGIKSKRKFKAAKKTVKKKRSYDPFGFSTIKPISWRV